MIYYFNPIVKSEVEVQIPPVVKIGQSKMSAETEQTIIISCRVSGLPDPSVYWMKAGKVIVSSENTERGRFSLRFKNPFRLRLVDF